MRRRWGRWRGYMDELEEVMRVVGEQLREAEALLAESWERASWRARQRDSAEPEILRRALDIPFLGDLVRIAWRVGADADLSPPDFDGRAWSEGEPPGAFPAAARAAAESRLAARAPIPGEPPPARLRAAERTLAGRTRSLAVVLDDLVGARNASAVVRTAEALGLQEMHLVQREGRVALERTVTLLAERWLDLFWYREAEAAVEALRGRGYRILVCDHARGALPLDEVPLAERVAVVFGSEQLGVSPAMREAADGLFYLPTSGFASYMNVSVAAGISLYVLDRRMREQGLRAGLEEEDRAALRRAYYAGLARGDAERARRYLGWLGHPPAPAPDTRVSSPYVRRRAHRRRRPPTSPEE